MQFRSHRVRWLVTALLIAACAVVAACGDSDSSDDGTSSGTTAASQFPPSTYDPAVYGDLSGPVVWHDVSGGALTAAKEATIFRDFETLTGVKVQSDFTGDSTKLFATLDAGQTPPWNVIEFPTVADYLRARDKGQLERLDTSVVPVDKLEPGTYDEYGFHTTRYGIVLAWNTEKYPESGEQPTSMVDLFDTDRFPGKRCMFKYPEFGATLEAPLLADGVAPADLYPLDVDRAFAKLDTIKDDILWYSSGDDAIRLLKTGECDLGVAWTGRVFSAVERDDAPLAITWDDALYADGAFGIPKGAQNVEAAQAMLGMWLNDVEGQKELVQSLPYPTPYADDIDYPAALTPWLPAGANLDDAIAQDEVYYARNIDELSKQFTRWVGS